MAGSEQRRKKKLEARRRRTQEKKRAVARRDSSGRAGQLLSACRWPVVHSSVTDRAALSGLLTANIIRRNTNGNFVMVRFLVDLWCTGVKYVVLRVGNATLLADRLESLKNGPPTKSVSPAYIRKLVEQSAAYAESLGIGPHADYRMAIAVFGDIDPNDCSTEFEFGKNGKPCLVNAPNDSMQKIWKIVALLEQSVGTGNYDTVLINMPLSSELSPIDCDSDELFQFVEDADDDELDDDELEGDELEGDQTDEDVSGPPIRRIAM